MDKRRKECHERLFFSFFLPFFFTCIYRCTRAHVARRARLRACKPSHDEARGLHARLCARSPFHCSLCPLAAREASSLQAFVFELLRGHDMHPLIDDHIILCQNSNQWNSKPTDQMAGGNPTSFQMQTHKEHTVSKLIGCTRAINDR